MERCAFGVVLAAVVGAGSMAAMTPAARASDFAPAVNHAGPQYPFAVALADLDGGGALDVITADEGASQARATVLAGHGDGTLGAPAAYATGAGTYLLRARFTGRVEGAHATVAATRRARVPEG